MTQTPALQGLNGRTEIHSGHSDDADLNPHVIAAPGYMLYLVGRHNAAVQQVPIDPGEGFHAVIAALDKGRRIAAGDDYPMPTSDRTVIAALRLALVEGWAKDPDALAVARAILDTAAETDPDEKAGVAHMVQMIRENRLRAEVTS